LKVPFIPAAAWPGTVQVYLNEPFLSVTESVALLPGEMAYKHPLHNSQLRGQPVQLALGDMHDAERKVLFVGGRPILF